MSKKFKKVSLSQKEVSITLTRRAFEAPLEAEPNRSFAMLGVPHYCNYDVLRQQEEGVTFDDLHDYFD